MADGVSTRLQREISQHQKELERIETKVDEGMGRLKQEMEQLSADVKHMFDQLMAKFEGRNAGKVVVELPEEVDKSKEESRVSETKLQRTNGSGGMFNGFGDDFTRIYKASKLECPRFDGTDFPGWLLKVEQYFESNSIEDAAKVRVVMMHLDGRALQWHQYYANANGGLTSLLWSDYMKEMRKRFADTEFADPMSDLVTLKHTNTVDEYYEEFLHILNSLNLPTDYSLSVFISNLKADISRTVRLFSPKSLTHALNLAKQIEFLTQNSTKRHFIPYKNPPTAPPNTYNMSSTIKTSSLPPLLPTPNIPQLPSSSYSLKYSQYNKPLLTNSNSNIPRTSKLPTRQERDERRRKGLCMWCGVKFVVGHNCLKSQLYHMLVESDVDTEAEIEEFSDCVESLEEVAGEQSNEGERPIISLHALVGTDGYQTMRLQGRIKNHKVIILVDTGSTHNFVDSAVIRRGCWSLQSIPHISVTVANGEKLQVQEMCAGLTVEIQGETIAADFLVLPLRGCDMVLGVQWLITVGPILWDFMLLTMQFRLGDRLIKWWGL